MTEIEVPGIQAEPAVGVAWQGMRGWEKGSQDFKQLVQFLLSHLPASSFAMIVFHYLHILCSFCPEPGSCAVY